MAITSTILLLTSAASAVTAKKAGSGTDHSKRSYNGQDVAQSGCRRVTLTRYPGTSLPRIRLGYVTFGVRVCPTKKPGSWRLDSDSGTNATGDLYRARINGDVLRISATGSNKYNRYARYEGIVKVQRCLEPPVVGRLCPQRCVIKIWFTITADKKTKKVTLWYHRSQRYGAMIPPITLYGTPG
ncbi:hypothetical protein ACFWY5_57810 [Nonomuraea sp. NPDC059007]|uniref:hypothetical protein n=1 Tax=Nonomuraea sp. NPDC059007 TaxID=3346692 RepID=UPI0036CBE6CE